MTPKFLCCCWCGSDVTEATPHAAYCSPECRRNATGRKKYNLDVTFSEPIKITDDLMRDVTKYEATEVRTMESNLIRDLIKYHGRTPNEAGEDLEKVYKLATMHDLRGGNPWVETLEAVRAVLDYGGTEATDWDDAAAEIADGMVSPYTVKRVLWASETAARGAVVPESLEGGTGYCCSDVAAALWYEYEADLVNEAIAALGLNDES